MTCPHHPSPAPSHPVNKPLTVLNAAASIDPAAMLSFYQSLRSATGLGFDKASNCWIAAQPELAQAALLHPDLGVRPPGQQLPPGLVGRRFGAVFAQWLRMRDDASREAEKAAVQEAIEGLAPTLLQECAAAQASLALQVGWRHWQWASLPCSIAGLLGLPMRDIADQQRLLACLAALALALKPQAELAVLEQADQAVDALCAELGGTASAPLALALRTQAQSAGLGLAHSPAWWQAQALALLWQAYEAGAGLLGQALLVAAERQSRASKQAPADLATCSELLEAVSRQPGSIHHTRRWALRDCNLGGQDLRAGDALLIILAGDASQPIEPLGFGLGRHRCPGRDLTRTLGAVALQLAIKQGLHESWPELQGFEPLANARIPVFKETTFNNAYPDRSPA